MDVGLVAQEAAATYEYLTSQQDGLLPHGLTAEQLAERALLLSDLLATGSTFRTLQMLKRHPALLQMPPDVVSEMCGCRGRGSTRAHATHTPTLDAARSCCVCRRWQTRCCS